MDKLTFLLIIAGIGVVLLVAMFTYYKHHKKINDEIESFNNHAQDIDDVLLKERGKGTIEDEELPSSFSANRNDNFDIDQVHLNNDSVAHNQSSFQDGVQDSVDADHRELVDGVYINTKRVISQNNSSRQSTIPSFKTQTSTFAAHKEQQAGADTPRDRASEKAEAADEQPETAEAPDAGQAQEATLPDEPKKQPQQNIKIIAVSVPDGVEDLIISHSILARDQYFNGTQLYQAFERAGLKYGEMNIYHYPGDDNLNTYALFSVANIVEPGTFDPAPEAAAQFTTPGISLFMRLPSKIDNYQAYEKLLVTAQQLAEELNGELCDETRSQLTRQAISYKKEQIRKLNFEIAKAERLAGISH